MSLLGPDDFGLGKKGRLKKLARDLSPSARKFIEEWLDKECDPRDFERVAELVGQEEAQRLMMECKRRKRKAKMK